MIKIDIEQQYDDIILLNPIEMLNNTWDYGTVFRLYSRGKATDEYFICCGRNEKHLINFWYDDEEETHKLSTDGKKSIKEYRDHVKVAVLPHAEINIQFAF